MDEYLSRMKALAKDSDWEAAHSDADDILCEVLRALGYTDLIDYYDKIDKCYA